MGCLATPEIVLGGSEALAGIALIKLWRMPNRNCLTGSSGMYEIFFCLNFFNKNRRVKPNSAFLIVLAKQT